MESGYIAFGLYRIHLIHKTAYNYATLVKQWTKGDFLPTDFKIFPMHEIRNVRQKLFSMMRISVPPLAVKNSVYWGFVSGSFSADFIQLIFCNFVSGSSASR